MTHICVGNLTIIASDNGLSPGRRQAIIWTNAGILLIGPLWTNFSEILIEIPTFSLKKMRLKVPSAKWRPCCFGLNVLIRRLFLQQYAILSIQKSHCVDNTILWEFYFHDGNSCFKNIFVIIPYNSLICWSIWIITKLSFNVSHLGLEYCAMMHSTIKEGRASI